MNYEQALKSLTDKQLSDELREMASEYGATDDGYSLSVAFLLREAATRFSERVARLPTTQGFECPRHGRILYGRSCTDADCECATADEGRRTGNLGHMGCMRCGHDHDPQYDCPDERE